ncbi:hypothetical protein BGX29_001993 [Mortierella sp. GBA35]|nr:hypothetical protein BGX29_001993 [Mortierella sp. GBA35]
MPSNTTTTSGVNETAGNRTLHSTSGLAPTGATPAPGPWRPASLTGRNSPAPPSHSTASSRDHHIESSPSNHSGMTPLRPAGGGGDRARAQPTSSSSSYSSSPSPSTGAWVASSRRVPSAGQGQGQDRAYSEQSLSVSSSPILSSSSTFGRQGSLSSTSTLHSTTPSGLGSTASGTHSTSGTTGGNGMGNGIGTVSSSTSTSSSLAEQPLNMEALAAKFADSKETKEKFAALQLSPALGTPDKERRNPMGAFAPPSSGNPHVAHIKVQRTASPGGNKLQPGLHAQSTDMRRTASHNNAFSSGLGAPLSGGASNGHAHSSTSSGTLHAEGSNSNGHNQAASPSTLSPVLAPFSLGQMTRTTIRRSSLNPQDSGSSHHQDHASPSQTPVLSPSVADKHPLQHAWTLYYDITAGYNRQGPSLHIYENGLRDMGTFTTVELFARFFNWIKKPHKIENSSNYHLFKDGIKPMWEDPANASGGRWIVTLLTKNPELLDRCWMDLAYALVGEQLDLGDDICGAVLSRRTKADRLAVWVRDKDNVDVVNGIGKRLIKFLDLAKEKISLEFQITTDAKSSGLLKNYITLETIRNELAQEAESSSTRTPTGDKATPSLTIDSVSVTPESAAEASPDTPGPSLGSSTQEESEGGAPTTVGTSGLLISVDGKGVFTA